MFVRGLLTPEAEGLAIVRTPNCSLAILLSVVGIWHMALTTGVNVAARPGRVRALGSFAVDAGRFGDAGAGRANRRGRRRNGRPRVWMADRARECGLVLQADAFRASPEKATQAPKTGWPYVDPNPLGTLRQSRTAFYRLLPGLIRRPGAKDPDHEYVANTAVDRHHRRRYAPAGLIEYLDAGGSGDPRPAGPAPGNTSATAGANETGPTSPLVRLETSIGGVR